ncbi:MAG: DUF389 domain-containing protein [Rhizorhabdus sp.]
MTTQTMRGLGQVRRWWSIWAAGVDHDAVLRQIAEDSGWSGRYLFLVVISAMISLLGLLMPSVAVLIGAMLLSPLMMPIIGLGFGIATVDPREIRRCATALLVGALLAVALSVVCVTLSPIQTITSEIAGRTRPTLFDLLVALLSAVAGAYALIRGRGGAVVGVAIAIALMPPLVVVGFGIATLNWTVFAGSLLLFVTNAITIALTAALVARIYGFGAHLSPQHTGWQLLLFLIALGLLSIPLGAALRQIAFEAVAQRQVRETISARFPDASRLGQLNVDYGATPIRIRAVVLTPRLDPKADQLLAADLRRRLERPIDVHVDQLRVEPNSSGLENAQIANASNASRSTDAERQQQAVANVALIAGVQPDAVKVDIERRMLSTTASTLPGMPVTLYRLLEQRAGAAAPVWTVRITPPADAPLPPLNVDDGVIDDDAMNAGAWVSARDARTMLVNGGSRAQRRAVATGVNARGGNATEGTGSGSLRFEWADPDAPPPKSGT